jgi:hypothetical protein
LWRTLSDRIPKGFKSFFPKKEQQKEEESQEKDEDAAKAEKEKAGDKKR